MRTILLAGVLPTASRDEFSEETFAVIQMDELDAVKQKLVIAVNPEVSINNPQIESVARRLRDAS
jgi:hypothetical protein